MDAGEKFLALRVRHFQNLGAFAASVGAHLATNNVIRCFPGMYLIPHIDVGVQCVFTNTLPTGPYRGAGRPEANYVMERLVEEAARVTGIGAVELRRRNLIPLSAIPYKSAVGTTYDSGDFAAVYEKALALADQKGFRKRRDRSAAAGKLRGFGVSCFLEHAGAIPKEGARLVFAGDGKLLVFSASQSSGQGHATVFPRMLAERLGIPPEQIELKQGDSADGIAGYASVGSRTMQAAGSAIAGATDAMLGKGRTLAAKILEAPEQQVSFRAGAFEVTGTNRHISLFDLATRARELHLRGEIAENLDTYSVIEAPTTFPNGCHVAEVEIDPSTGSVAVAAYTAMDDCGRVIDHTLVEAQVQGGFAQGLGQALLEETVHDPESGQLLSASLMDYGIPRADQVPDVRGDVVEAPATTNPLGVKGVGEAGTTASLAAIMNAIADAIPGGHGAKLDMPATPEKVWRACKAAGL
jgi:carbon-monoxide dehydrogenase large subunit